MAAYDSNPGSLIREFDVLATRHCVPRVNVDRIGNYCNYCKLVGIMWVIIWNQGPINYDSAGIPMINGVHFCNKFSRSLNYSI